jgi:RNA polymerase primary sigma factor
MRQLKINKSITYRENVSINKYLNEISKKQMISPEEEIELAKAIRQGDQDALMQLTTANLRFVVSVAKQYQNKGIALDDLINEGNIGLIKAASRFDETRGFKFISYAVWWIRQSIMAAVAEQSRIIRLPLNKVGAFNKIRKMQATLEQVLERPPTVEELAEVLPISEQEIRATLQASVQHTSMDISLDGDSLTLADLLSDKESHSPDASLIIDSLNREIQRALNTLSTRERDVLVHFYGIGGAHAMTLDEIGVKYELTRERVRQIKEKALRKLRLVSRNKHLQTYLDY